MFTAVFYFIAFGERVVKYFLHGFPYLYSHNNIGNVFLHHWPWFNSHSIITPCFRLWIIVLQKTMNCHHIENIKIGCIPSLKLNFHFTTYATTNYQYHGNDIHYPLEKGETYLWIIMQNDEYLQTTKYNSLPQGVLLNSVWGCLNFQIPIGSLDFVSFCTERITSN